MSGDLAEPGACPLDTGAATPISRDQATWKELDGGRNLAKESAMSTRPIFGTKRCHR